MKVVILCGGKGTRSYPFTEYYPKVMMPIHGTPIIVHLIQIYARQGVTDFILAAGHRKEILMDYCQGRFVDWNVHVLDTGAESDTGDRIKACEPYVGERFFATYGDGLGCIDLEALLNFHATSGGLATLTSVPLLSQYGLVVSDVQGKVCQFREKPVIADCWINAGFFVFEKQAFQYWEGHNLETEVLPNLSKQGLLSAYQHRGFWKSMDTTKDQQEMEAVALTANPPWMPEKTAWNVPPHPPLARVARANGAG
jgi:glucose-1-phosphate cytidylyltransferase